MWVLGSGFQNVSLIGLFGVRVWGVALWGLRFEVQVLGLGFWV